MPLAYSPIGNAATVQRINGNDAMRRHLESLGFVAGTIVTIVSELNGDLIVNVKGTRVANSKNLATRILVA